MIVENIVAKPSVDAGLVDVTYERRSGNGVIMVDYIPDDAVAAQYPEASYAFVYSPLWFTGYAADLEVSAYVKNGNFFVSGYWMNWDTSGAAGQPIILHGVTEDSSSVTLMGIDPTFRAHPEHTFRLLANAIYLNPP